MGNWNLEITVSFQTVLAPRLSEGWGRLDGRQHRHAKAPSGSRTKTPHMSLKYTQESAVEAGQNAVLFVSVANLLDLSVPVFC